MTGHQRLFIAYRIVSRLYFHLPVLFIYFLVGGLPLWGIAVALAAYGITMTVAAPLSKIVSARLGERDTLIAAEMLKGAGLGLLLVDVSIPVAISGEVVCGLGYVLGAGPDALFLRRLSMADKTFNRIQAASQSYMFVSIFAAGVVGGWLFSQDPDWPLLASVGATAASVLVLLALPRGPVEKKAVPSGTSSAEVGRASAMPAVIHFWTNYYALSRGMLLGAFVGLLPYYFFRVLEVDVAYFGAILGSFSLFAFVAARYALKIAERFGTSTFTAVSLLLMAGALAGTALTDSLPVALVIMGLLGLSSGAIRPVTLSALSAVEVEPATRANVMVGMERRFGLLNAAVVLVGGCLIDSLGVQWVLGGLCVVFLALIGGLTRTLRSSPPVPVVVQAN